MRPIKQADPGQTYNSSQTAQYIASYMASTNVHATIITGAGELSSLAAEVALIVVTASLSVLHSERLTHPNR